MGVLERDHVAWNFSVPACFTSEKEKRIGHWIHSGRCYLYFDSVGLAVGVGLNVPLCWIGRCSFISDENGCYFGNHWLIIPSILECAMCYDHAYRQNWLVIVSCKGSLLLDNFCHVSVFPRKRIKSHKFMLE